MAKFFKVTILESGWSTYLVKGEDGDTIESIRAALDANEITLDDLIRSDITDTAIDEIEEA